MVDTLAALRVPKTLAPMVTRPKEKPLPLPRNTSTTTPPEQRHLVPPTHLQGDECVGPLCRYVANALRSQLSFDVDPCSDFYQYVCGKFRGTSTRIDTAELVRWMTEMNLDFLNTTRLASIDPVEVMVRGSLDFGVEAIVSITLHDYQFDPPSYKRRISVRQ
ncbi:hypothetical protein HPB52_021611 [Rhipicephalus sanguineus]|uniref:Uncharacterized protein n=1 Tax=Rhipicephalus sanguineus TaxID=34632 RepID=A0A9D4QC45_RHISA|nr:hypothetical protein HPB52_021611 [Rhipicephalus sanguineus]